MGITWEMSQTNEINHRMEVCIKRGVFGNGKGDSWPGDFWNHRVQCGISRATSAILGFR